MKKISLVVVVVLLVVFLGVSCNYEMAVSECNLKTKGISLEISGVTYQYSVEKNGAGKNTAICDWTDFDIDTGFSVKNLRQGTYTFSVRGIVGTSQNPTVVAFGKETCSLPVEKQVSITIVLYPQFDKSNPNSKLKINLLSTASGELSAFAVCKYLGLDVETVSGSMSNCDTGFCSEFTLTPGYYEVSVFLYQDNIEVGGNVQVVTVPTGCTGEINVSISPRSVSNVVDIRDYNCIDHILTVKKDSAVTLAMPGAIGTEGSGFWMVGNSVIEDSATYIKLKTSAVEDYIVTYYRGSQSWSCKVSVSAGKKAVVNILNFRSNYQSAKDACIGYRFKDSGEMLSVTPKEYVVPDNFNPTDYTTLNLEMVCGSVEGAEFVEVNSFSIFNLLNGSSTVNSTIKKMVVHGDIGYNAIGGRLPNLEEIVIVDAKSIEGKAFQNMQNLKTIRIIPSGQTSIGPMAFSGSGVTKIYVYGTESSIKKSTGWSSGSSVTDSTFIFNSELPL